MRYETTVVPGRFFGAPDHFRLALGCPPETLEGGSSASPGPSTRPSGRLEFRGRLLESALSEFAPAIAVADLPPGKGAEVVVDGQAIAVFNVGGTFHALAGRCPHRGGPLGAGFLDGSTVSCPWHDFTFDVTTGENVASGGPRATRYEVKVEDGKVFVKLG